MGATAGGGARAIHIVLSGWEVRGGEVNRGVLQAALL